jgi:hypothetical protein
MYKIQLAVTSNYDGNSSHTHTYAYSRDKPLLLVALASSQSSNSALILSVSCITSHCCPMFPKTRAFRCFHKDQATKIVRVWHLWTVVVFKTELFLMTLPPLSILTASPNPNQSPNKISSGSPMSWRREYCRAIFVWICFHWPNQLSSRELTHSRSHRRHPWRHGTYSTENNFH